MRGVHSLHLGGIVLATTTAGLLAILSSVAEPAVLCTAKSGQGPVRVRPATCRASEVQLDPGALGLQGPPGNQGPPGPVILAAFDANGVRVGDVVAVNLDLTDAVVSVDGVVLRLTRNRLVGTNGTSDVYYEAPNCAGPPLLHNALVSVVPPVAVVQGLVLEAETGGAVVDAAESLQVFNGTCTNVSRTGPFVRALPVADLSALVPPFSVRAP